MNRSLLTLCAFVCAISALFSQAPDAFNYQAVARDAGGDAVTNQSIGVQFQLHQTTAGGMVVYSETHNPTTSEQGLFSVEVGNGTLGIGTFAAIDWKAGPYFMEVGLDPAGGSSYISIGTQQLLSVPYALFANDDDDWKNDGDTLYVVGNRIGIGTATPSTLLQIEGTFSSGTDRLGGFELRSSSGFEGIGMGYNTVYATGSNANVPIRILSKGQGDISLRTNNTERLVIHGINGNVGIGTNSLISKFSVGGNAYFTDDVGIGIPTPTHTLTVLGSASKSGGGSWSVFSDRRLKKNIKQYNDGLATVLEIEPVRFSYNKKSACDTEIEYVGVVAQELEKIAPYMVGEFELNGEQYLDVDNSAMTYMLINAVKELSAENDVLRAENAQQSDLIEVNTELLLKLQEYLDVQSKK